MKRAPDMPANRSEKLSPFKWSIKWKLMIIITVLVVSLVAILSYAQISNQKRILEAELKNRIALMKANLIERGKSYIINLSQQVENDLAAFNLSGVLTALEDAVENNKAIKYAILMNSAGIAFVNTQKPELAQTKLTGERDLNALSYKNVKAIRYEDNNKAVIEIVNPLQISTEPWGVLRLTYTLEFLEIEIESSQKQIQQEIKRMIYRSVATSLGFLAVCLFIVFFLSARFSKPLIQLTNSAKKLSKGNFSVSSDIQIRSQDEIGILGASFIEMSKDLEGSYKKLEEYSNRYRALFEYSPISLWEEDLSRVKQYLDELRDKGVRDLRKLFDKQPDKLGSCFDMIRILDVNRATLELYEADSRETLTRNLYRLLGENSHSILKEELLAIVEGKIFEAQAVNRTLTGREITVLRKVSVPPGYEDTWSKVLISVHDLSERMRAKFLKDMFGRYLSEEVTNTLLENPDLVKLGGENRSVTIMMTDLRGFTALCERLKPEQVVQMLNIYFEVMVEVIDKYQGTINSFIGDALLVIFGAPQEMPDRSARAIACAIEMQNAMIKVNKQNRLDGLFELEMGIGLNETEVIVGNIGSSTRSQYTVIGSGVNMASRIESYTVGGQILVSESVYNKAGSILRIDAQRDVFPKGSEVALRIYEVGGIAGSYNIALEDKAPTQVAIAQQIPLRCSVLEKKDVGEKGFKAFITRLSNVDAEIIFSQSLEILSNIKMNLTDVDEKLSVKHFYGKVIHQSDENEMIHTIRFTSIPPEIDAYFEAFRQHFVEP